MERRLIGFSLVILLSGVPVLTAQTIDHAQLCMGGPTVSPDRQIEGCTAFVQSGSSPKTDLASAYANRGQAYIRKNDYDRAIADYSRSIELARTASAYFGRAFAYHRKREYERAIRDYDEVLKIDPAHDGAKRNRDAVVRLVRLSVRLKADTVIRRGDAHWDAKRFDDAIHEYSEAIRIDPGNTLALTKRGRAYQQKGDIERAMADYDEALRLDPKNSAALASRAELWANRGDFARAASDLRKSIALEEQVDGLQYLTLSEYYSRLRQYEPALEAIREAQKLEGDDGFPVRHQAGRVLQRLGRHKEAVVEFSAALARFPKSAEAYYRRGLSYEKLGDRNKARQDFRQLLLKSDPKDWDRAGDSPGEVQAKLMEYGLR